MNNKIMGVMNMDIRYFMAMIIITYIPFHFFEEALGNFPKWMYAISGYLKQ